MFGFRQLVDIAERALSPSDNDPSTAVQALDQLHDLLRSLATRAFPSSHCAGSEGRLRLLLPRPEFADYVRLSFEEIRCYGSGAIQVVRKMRRMLEDLHSIALPERKACFEHELALLAAAVAHARPELAQ